MSHEPDVDPDTALQLSLQRLAHSRQRLRNTLLPPPDAADHEAPGITRLVPRRLRVWLRRGPLGPVVRTLDPWLGTVQRTMGRWWRRHPWRPAFELAGGTAEQTLVPFIRRHPTTAIAVGAAAGAALALAAPWRWDPLRNAARGSSRSMQRWAWRQMTSPAAQAVLASVFASIWTANASATSARDAAREGAADGAAAAASGAAPAPEPDPSVASL